MTTKFHEGDYVEVKATRAGGPDYRRYGGVAQTRYRFWEQRNGHYHVSPPAYMPGVAWAKRVALRPDNTQWLPVAVKLQDYGFASNDPFTAGDRGLVQRVHERGNYVYVQFTPGGRGWVPVQQLIVLSSWADEGDR
jgi:hypothetical protein